LTENPQSLSSPNVFIGDPCFFLLLDSHLHGNVKILLDSRNRSEWQIGRGNDKKNRGNDKMECAKWQHHCHPQLDWESSVFFPFPIYYFLSFPNVFIGNPDQFFISIIKNRFSRSKIQKCTPGMTTGEYLSSESRNLFFFLFYLKRNTSWIPAFAGMTNRSREWQIGRGNDKKSGNDKRNSAEW